MDSLREMIRQLGPGMWLDTRQPMDRLVLPRSDSAGPQFMIPLPR